MPSEHCDHDWRVDPNVILASNPPRQRLVCAICGAVSSRVVLGAKPSVPASPEKWERA